MSIRPAKSSELELDLQRYELRRGDTVLRLEKLPLELLTLLVEHRDRVVGREEIIERLWGKEVFLDTEQGINTAIRKIRQVLHDDPDRPRFVQTMFGRGYRFIAPISVTCSDLSARAAAGTPVLPLESEPAPPETQETLNDKTKTTPWRPQIPNQSETRLPERTADITALKPSRVSGTTTARRRGLVIATLVISAAALVGGAYLRSNRVSPVREIKQRRLTANPSGIPVDGAVISPDGKYLAYSDQNGIHLQLIGANETHTLESPPGFSPSRAGLYPIAWFPSGTRLLVNTALEGRRSIWVSSILGGTPKRLRDDAVGQAVSPDGSLIAFTVGITRIGDREVWLMTADGQDARKLVTVDEHSGVGRVAWSPDGQRIDYQRFFWEADKFQTSVESCDFKGSQPVVLLSDPALIDFWWGPGGRLIYSRSELRPNEKDSNLWEIRIDPRTAKPSSEPRRITNWAGFSFRNLTGTSDGKRMSAMKASVESDVYVGTLVRNGEGLKAVRRLTLDEHDDLPFGWTPDSKTVIFSSNRNGPVGIFKQALDRDSAEAIPIGAEEALVPTLSPDGLWIVYAATLKAQGSSISVRLMRVPLSGGVPQEILKTNSYITHDCGRFAGTLCVFGELTESEIVLWAFDPVRGKGRELTRISLSPSELCDLAVAPDGSRIATTKSLDPEGRIRILSLTGEPERDVVVNGWGGFGTVNWQADGKGFFVSSQSPRAASLLHVGMDGHAQVLWEQKGSWNAYGVSSPDGRYLAFHGSTSDSNVWLIENF